jgi:hypothetical protein
MCGIVGIAGDLDHSDQDVIKRLLILDYFRGQDSTGLAAIRKNFDTEIAKGAMNPLDLFDTGAFRTVIGQPTNTHLFLGHNRAMTRGTVNKQNAHPFDVDNIIGVHNGTLEYASHTALEKILGYSTPTDSLAIFAAIAKVGLKEALAAMRGAWSMVWYDKDDHSLNFLRNGERPMWWGYSKECDKIYFASMWEMINSAFVLGKSIDQDFWENKAGNTFFATDVDTHYRFDLAELAANKGRLPKCRLKKGMVGAPEPVTPKYTPVVGNYRPADDPFPKKVEPRADTLYVNRGYGPDLPEKEFERLAALGCCWCRAPIKDGDNVLYLKANESLLGECCTPYKKTTKIIVPATSATMH